MPRIRFIRVAEPGSPQRSHRTSNTALIAAPPLDTSLVAQSPNRPRPPPHPPHILPSPLACSCLAPPFPLLGDGVQLFAALAEWAAGALGTVLRDVAEPVLVGL